MALPTSVPSSTTASTGLPRRVAVVILGAATVLLFALQVRQHYFLGDDSYISFRYARHLVNGQGLVWNPGEYVEGYTNFLWVLLMAAAMKVRLTPEWASNALGIVSGAGVLVILWVLALRWSTRRTLLALLPPFLLAASRTFTSWTTGGLETMWFTFLVTAALLVVIEESRRRVDVPIGSATLLVLAALTRPEGILFAGVVGVWLAAEAALDRRRVRPLVIWAVVVGVTIGTHLLWRHAYYGAWVPNTFAAKVPAAWWDQGLKYAYDFTRAYGVPLFAPLVVWAQWRHPDRHRLLIAACVATYVLYVIAVGGDHFEFRFWIPVLPLTYWLVADAVERLRPSKWLAALAAAALIGATVHGSWQSDRDQLPPWHGINSVANIKGYAAHRAREGRRLRQLIDAGLLDAQLLLGVTGAGAVPYYTDWPTVDRHGLNDRYIANLPVVERSVMGHEHDAPLEYLERRRVVINDAFNQLVFWNAEDIPAAGDWLEPRPLYIADLGDAYLVFDSFVPEAEVRQAFARLPSLSVREPRTDK